MNLTEQEYSHYNDVEGGLDEALDYMGDLPIHFLLSLFPEQSVDSLSKIFEENGYEFDRTLELLMHPENYKEPTPVASSIEETISSKNVKVCRHFLEGKCFRKDCWFSHSLDKTVCKFWLRGNCLNGTNCNFLHKVDVDNITTKLQNINLNKVEPKKEVKPLDSTEFPEISQSRVGSNTAQFWKGNRIASSSDTISKKIEFLSKRVGWVPSNILKQYLVSARNNEITALAMLQQKFPKPKQDIKSVKVVNSSTSLEKRIKNIPKQPELKLPWVKTGASVNQEYLDARNEAIKLAKIRNTFFEKARKAYLSNRMELAKSNSIEGQKYNNLMKEQHNLAAQAIINNRKLNMDSAVLDLHGLHVKEAIEMLKESIDLLKRERKIDNTLYIITGSGHHSKQNPRLLPNVLDLLDELNIYYVDCSTDGRGGMLKLFV